MNEDFQRFVRARLNELHQFVFDPEFCKQFDPKTVATNRLAWKFYQRRMYAWGFGRCAEDLPQLQLPILP